MSEPVARRWSRGQKLALAWAMFVQMLLVILVGLSFSHINEVISGHTAELNRINHNAAVTSSTASRVKHLEKVVLTLIQKSKHPSAIEFQLQIELCRLTPHCRIP